MSALIACGFAFFFFFEKEITLILVARCGAWSSGHACRPKTKPKCSCKFACSLERGSEVLFQSQRSRHDPNRWIGSLCRHWSQGNAWRSVRELSIGRESAILGVLQGENRMYLSISVDRVWWSGGVNFAPAPIPKRRQARILSVEDEGTGKCKDHWKKERSCHTLRDSYVAWTSMWIWFRDVVV